MKRIVVVDDQPILGTIYRTKFATEGFQVDVASDGQEALDLIQRTNPDLVLLDLMLPKIDGLEVLKKLRAQSTFQTLPIIVFSANARPGISEEAFAAGAFMVLSKSNTSPKQVIEIVNRTLAEAAQPPGAGKVLESPMARAPGGLESQAKGHIVLLEDHAETRAIISLLLSRKGHHVTSVLAPADAMMLAKSNRIDLFLINRGQSDSSTSICREMRTTFPDTPVIVYSTEAKQAEKEEVLQAGALRYLGTPEELLDVAEISSSVITDSQTKAARLKPTLPQVIERNEQNVTRPIASIETSSNRR
jgi:CheY-like chemotaxis protein